MLKGFQNFILRGNVVDLAVGVVIGAAFGKIASGIVNDIIMPLIALVVGKPDFSAIQFYVGQTKFPVGDLITSVIDFLLVALAVYFLVVLPVNALMARLKRGEVTPDPTTKKCPECLSEIPIPARKCAFCTSVVA